MRQRLVTVVHRVLLDLAGASVASVLIAEHQPRALGREAVAEVADFAFDRPPGAGVEDRCSRHVGTLHTRHKE